MAKSLGQIHTADFEHTITSPPGGGNAGESNMLLDLSGVLTDQLQHMVRCGGNSFKLVGLDMGLELEDSTGTDAASVTVSGELLYYAPTAGRCAAMREAFGAIKRAFKLSGINYRSNKNYDFRPLISSGLSNAADFKNQASIEILSGSPTPLYIKDQSESTTGIFENWNNSVSNQQSGTPDFSVGWNIMQQDVPQDYVLNEGTYLKAGGRMYADPDYEVIPFQIALDNSDGHASATFQFRPDPALYQAILAGQIILSVKDCVFTNVSDDNTPIARLNISSYVSGWKSIMSR
tara:strand:+ start:167 stop:1039 length:873 start_codon:yes stop_codon:yes gene_type:complete